MANSGFPKISYTSKDYASLRQSMLDNVTDPTGSAVGSFAQWTAARDPSPNDFGVALIEAFAYTGDILSWYNDRLAQESFLASAALRSSVLNIAQSLDYQPIIATAATVTLTFTVVAGNSAVVIPAGTQVSTAQPSETAAVVVFETDIALTITQNSTQTVSGTVTATQGRTVSAESAGTSTGAPSQTYTLLQPGVISDSVIVLVDEGTGPQVWTNIEHLIDANPYDTIFTLSTDAENATRLTFGDGVTGKIPVPGALISVTYRIGGGTLGNVGIGAITELVTYISGVIPPSPAVGYNAVAATGGTDAESTESIRRNAPRALSTLKRCVTMSDYANVTLGIPRVAKASATGRSYTNVVLFVCDYTGRLPATLETAVKTYLADKTMAGAQVTVVPPVFVPIQINVNIVVGSRYSQAAVTARVLDALNVAYSLDHVDFGQQVNVSDVYAVLLAVPGVQSVVVTVLTSTLAPSASLGVTTGLGEIPILEPSYATINATGGI